VSYESDRAEAYAEATLEGRTLPTHDLIARGRDELVAHLALKTSEPTCPACKEHPHPIEECPAVAEAEAAITADMEILKSWLTMAFTIGYRAGAEALSRGRR